MTVLPLFVSTYSLPTAGGILTLDEPGKAKPGAPVSVFDLAQQAGLKEVILTEERPDGFVAAYKTATKLGLKLCFGLKLTVCADATIKDEASRATESKVIVFARDTEGYHKLVSIWNRAACDGFYFTQRSGWAWLKEQWSDHLLLALPWASSFIARNTLSFNRIVPDLPARPWVFKEVASGLPFAPLIDAAIDRYVADTSAPVQEVKTVYYSDAAAFKAFQVYRCIGERSSWASPGIDHLSSDQFSFAAWQALCPPPTPPSPASP